MRLIVSDKNLPVKIPIGGMLITALVLDRFQAPGWLWGVAGTTGLFISIGVVILAMKSKRVDLSSILTRSEISSGKQ